MHFSVLIENVYNNREKIIFSFNQLKTFFISKNVTIFLDKIVFLIQI